MKSKLQRPTAFTFSLLLALGTGNPVASASTPVASEAAPIGTAAPSAPAPAEGQANAAAPNLAPPNLEVAPAAAPATAPPRLRVVYSRSAPGRGLLKEDPHEVTVVSTTHTGNAVAGQVALNALTLIAFGGISVRGFSKDELRGSSITDVTDRANLRNPVATDFLIRVQERVNAWLETQPDLKAKRYGKELTIHDGRAKLVYEGLGDDSSQVYRLKNSLLIFKHREKDGFFQIMPPPMVTCDFTTEAPAALEAWSANNYARVKVELDASLSACTDTIVGALEKLVKD